MALESHSDGLHHVLIPSADAAAWDAALSKVQHGPGHLREYCDTIASDSGNACYLYLCEGDAGAFLCPLIERHYRGCRDLVTPIGPCGFTGIGTVSNFQPAWHQFMKSNGFVCAYVTLNPVFECAELFPRECRSQTNVNFLIDLSQTLDDLEANLSAKHRRIIRSSRKKGKLVVRDRERLIDAFVALYPAFMDRVSAAADYRLKKETLLRLLGADFVELFGFEMDGSIVAVHAYTFTDDVADAFLAAMARDGRPFARFLHWIAIVAFKSKNILYLNLGGGMKDGDELASFKSHFGGEEKPVEVIKQVFDPTTFAGLCKHAGVEPDDPGFFPPYHRPGP